MDLQFWIYVAIVVLSILAQARRKKKQQEERDRQTPADPRAEPQPKPLSFEDLLREIQEAKSPPPARQQPAQAREFDEFETSWEPEEKSLETAERVPAPQPAFENSYEIYEKAKAEAFNRASLEETMKVEDTVVHFGKFKRYEKAAENPAAAAIAAAFADFEQVKKAFIMGEVLKPKF